MEIIFDKVQIGIEKYSWIMKRVHETDVSVDIDFQRAFNGFYRMRQHPEHFYRVYYKYKKRVDFCARTGYNVGAKKKGELCSFAGEKPL